MNKIYRYMEDDKPTTEQAQDTKDKDTSTQENLIETNCITNFASISSSFKKPANYFVMALQNNKDQVSNILGALQVKHYCPTLIDVTKSIENNQSNTGRVVYTVFQIAPSIINIQPEQNQYNYKVTQIPLDTKDGNFGNTPYKDTLKFTISTSNADKYKLEKDFSILTNMVCCIYKDKTLLSCVPIMYTLYTLKENTPETEKPGYFKLSTPNKNTAYYAEVSNKLFPDNQDVKNVFSTFINFLTEKNTNFNLTLNIKKGEVNPDEKKSSDKNDLISKESRVNPLSKEWSVVQKTLADNFIQKTFKTGALSLSKDESISVSLDNTNYSISFGNNTSKINFKLIERLSTRPLKIRLQEGSVLFGGSYAVSNNALTEDLPLKKETLKYNLELDDVTISSSATNTQNLNVNVGITIDIIEKIVKELCVKFQNIFDQKADTELLYGNYSFKVKVNLLDKEIKCTPVDTSKGIYDISIPVEVTKTDIKQRTLSKVKGVLAPGAAVAGGILTGIGSLAKGSSYKSSLSL